MSTLSPEPGEPLTEAEQEVMNLVCLGLTNKEIGESRLTGVGTAKSQVQSVLVKLKARNRTHAAAIYARNNITERCSCCDN